MHQLAGSGQQPLQNHFNRRAWLWCGAAYDQRMFLKLKSHSLAIFLISISLVGCVSFKPDTALPVTVVASPNQDVRRPTMVVIHYTSNDDVEHSLDTLTSAVRKVSAHYLIDRQGRLYQLVPEERRAWHAGQSYWAGESDINSRSIGIELDNNASEPFDERQISTLLNLLQDIQTRHRIKPANIVGHSDVAPGRKVDPGVYFPWRRLAASGFGLWCESPEAVTESSETIEMLLTALGYDPRIPEASRLAFKSHYLNNGDGVIADDRSLEIKIAQCLYEQKAR